MLMETRMLFSSKLTGWKINVKQAEVEEEQIESSDIKELKISLWMIPRM